MRCENSGCAFDTLMHKIWHYCGMIGLYQFCKRTENEEASASKLRIFPTPQSFGAPLRTFSFEFHGEINSVKLKAWGYSVVKVA